jgi:hypothetical protein
LINTLCIQTQGYGTALAVSRRLPSTVTWVQSWGNSCVICGERSNRGAVFHLSTEAFPCHLSFHRCSTFIYHQGAGTPVPLTLQDQSIHCHGAPMTKRSRNSVVGIVASNRSSIPHMCKRFFSSPKRPVRLWTPLRLLLCGYRKLLPWEGVRRSKCEAHHSPHPVLEVNHKRSYISYSPCTFMASTATNLSFTILQSDRPMACPVSRPSPTAEAQIQCQVCVCSVSHRQHEIRPVSPQLQRLPPLSIIPPTLHTDIFIYHRPYIILAIDSVVKITRLKIIPLPR